MDNIEEKSIKFIRKNKKLLINKFASLDNYTSVIDPLTFFMAGSPGAGKTEYSKGFIEKLEGRPVPKEAFIEDFFLAKENVQKIKDEFGSDVHIYLVIKEDERSVKKTLFEVDKVDSFIDKKYTREELEDLISKIII